MNNFWTIACGAGLQDGLNPCIFMTCAVFIVYGLWLRKKSLRLGWPRIIFGLAYAAGTLEFNFGPAQGLVFQKNFIFTAEILYLVLGVCAFVLGISFFKDWFLMRSKPPVKDPGNETIKTSVGSGLAVCLTTVILAVVLSALATLWPINIYIMLLGNETILRGQWQMVMPLLAGYVVSGMWPLWFVWAFLSIKNLRPSLLKIFCAAIFFTASSCMILFFE